MHSFLLWLLVVCEAPRRAQATWHYDHSGNVASDSGDLIDWPGDDFVNLYRSEESSGRRFTEEIDSSWPTLPPGLPDKLPDIPDIPSIIPNPFASSKAALFYAFGDWGASNWVAGGEEKCKTDSVAWSQGEIDWHGDSCLHSMHHLCTTLGKAWRNIFKQRCTSGTKEFLQDENAQVNVATQMCNAAKDRSPKFTLGVGDNFYWSGVVEGNASEFRDKFENVYNCDGLQVPFLMSLGSHDYGGSQCEQMFGGTTSTRAQINHDKNPLWQYPDEHQGGRWVMPDRYYKKSFRFQDERVSLDVFIIDTNLAEAATNCGATCAMQQECLDFFPENQRKWEKWLVEELAASTANWRFVVGHHPFTDVSSLMYPGEQLYGGQRFMEMLARGGVTIYFAGHVPEQRYDAVEVIVGDEKRTVHQVVTGAGGGFQNAGGGLPPSFLEFNVSTKWAYTEYSRVSYGFSLVAVEPQNLTVDFINDEGAVMKSVQIKNEIPLRGEWVIDALIGCTNACGTKLAAASAHCTTDFGPECGPQPAPGYYRCYPITELKPHGHCDECSQDACSQCTEHFTLVDGICKNKEPFAEVWVPLRSSEDPASFAGRAPTIINTILKDFQMDTLNIAYWDMRKQDETKASALLQTGSLIGEKTFEFEVLLGITCVETCSAEGIQTLLAPVVDFLSTASSAGGFNITPATSENAGIKLYDKGLTPFTWGLGPSPAPTPDDSDTPTPSPSPETEEQHKGGGGVVMYAIVGILLVAAIVGVGVAYSRMNPANPPGEGSTELVDVHN